MQYIGKIDIDKFKCVSNDIITDEVIITDERIQHIRERHPNDYERFSKYIPQILEEPDYIIEAAKPKTAVILKEIIENNEHLQLVVRLKTSDDPEEYKNSIITFLKIDKKDWNRLIKNKNILYKRE